MLGDVKRTYRRVAAALALLGVALYALLLPWPLTSQFSLCPSPGRVGARASRPSRDELPDLQGARGLPAHACARAPSPRAARARGRALRRRRFRGCCRRGPLHTAQSRSSAFLPERLAT